MDSIIRRVNQKNDEADFVSHLQDDFPDTDKLPLDDEFRTDFRDSVIVEDSDAETVPAALYAEFEDSRTRSKFAALEKKHQQELPAELEPLWRFEFTDSALDLKHGTAVNEIASEDLWKKYFDK